MTTQRKFVIHEYTEKAAAALVKLKATQQPGQAIEGGKVDVLRPLCGQLKTLLQEGYTAKQIADFLESEDVFRVRPKTITEVAANKSATSSPKASKRFNARQATKSRAERDQNRAMNQVATELAREIASCETNADAEVV